MRSRRLAPSALALLAAFWLCGASAAFEKSNKTTEELMRMTEGSLFADWQENRAHARGVGRIVREGAQGRLLARRAALMDAERNLLLLRKRILKNSAERAKISRLSGVVPPLTLVGEKMEEGLYFVDLEASLSSLLGKKFSKKELRCLVERMEQN